jgi:hypothetical protein
LSSFEEALKHPLCKYRQRPLLCSAPAFFSPLLHPFTAFEESDEAEEVGGGSSDEGTKRRKKLKVVIAVGDAYSSVERENERAWRIRFEPRPGLRYSQISLSFESRCGTILPLS